MLTNMFGDMHVQYGGTYLSFIWKWHESFCRLREERLQRIERYKSRLGLLLHPPNGTTQEWYKHGSYYQYLLYHTAECLMKWRTWSYLSSLKCKMFHIVVLVGWLGSLALVIDFQVFTQFLLFSAQVCFSRNSLQAEGDPSTLIFSPETTTATL